MHSLLRRVVTGRNQPPKRYLAGDDWDDKWLSTCVRGVATNRCLLDNTSSRTGSRVLRNDGDVFHNERGYIHTHTNARKGRREGEVAGNNKRGSQREQKRLPVARLGETDLKPWKDARRIFLAVSCCASRKREGLHLPTYIYVVHGVPLKSTVHPRCHSQLIGVGPRPQ